MFKLISFNELNKDFSFKTLFSPYENKEFYNIDNIIFLDELKKKIISGLAIILKTIEPLLLYKNKISYYLLQILDMIKLVFLLAYSQTLLLVLLVK